MNVTVYKDLNVELEEKFISLKYMNNHMHRAPFSDIERKKEKAKSKE